MLRLWFLVSSCIILTVSISLANKNEINQDLFPHYPSLLKLQAHSAEFTDPETCEGCHPEKFEEWQGSVHALAFKDPIYQGELNKAFKAVGAEITKQCEGCHTPAGMMLGETNGAGISGLSNVALNGVSCDICHSVVGTSHLETPSHEPENGSLILSPGNKTKEGDVLIKNGPFTPTDECGMGFHECRESSLHLTSELCAGCHQVYHYEKHFPIEATYLEWKHGPYAQRGIECQDCHMVETSTFLKSAESFRKPERSEYRHFFNGANYLLYHLAKLEAEKSGNTALAKNLDNKFNMAVKRLQSAADLEVTPIYQNNTLQEIKVRVKNIRAGHNLPTSLTNIREMWLEIVMSNHAGQQIYASGLIDKKGHIEKNARIFNSDGMGDDFHFAVDPWIVTSFSKHETIPPKGFKDVYFGVPKTESKDIDISVKLRYRQADQKIAEKLLAAVPKDINLKEIYGIDKVPTLPIVNMVKISKKFVTAETDLPNAGK